MSPSRAIRAILATMLVAAGCSDESTTPLRPADIPPPDLLLTFPAFTEQDRMHVERGEVEPPGGPAGIFSEDPEEASPDMNAISEITFPRTDVGFQGAYAFSRGSHSYTGNVGRVETVATVSYEGQVIGTQPQAREVYDPFLLDFGRTKHMAVDALVFVEQECGLEVDGHSKHFAHWQWFLGSTVSTWGHSEAGSQAFPPVEQPPCQQQDGADGGYGGGSEDGGGSGGGGAVTCWYWVTYDLDTGDIYGTRLLFCDEAGEGG